MVTSLLNQKTGALVEVLSCSKDHTRFFKSRLNKTLATPKERIQSFKKTDDAFVRDNEGSFESHESASAELSRCVKAPEKQDTNNQRRIKKYESVKQAQNHCMPVHREEAKTQSRSTISNPSVAPAHKILIFDKKKNSRDDPNQSCAQKSHAGLKIYQRADPNDRSDSSKLTATRLAEENNIYSNHNDSYQRGSPSSSIYHIEALARNLKRKNCIASSTSIEAINVVEPSFMVDRLQKSPVQASSESLHCFQLNAPKSARDHIAIHEATQPETENSEPVTRPRFQSTFAFQKRVAQQTKERMLSFSPAPPIAADRSNFKLEIEISSLRFRIEQLETHATKQAESRAS